MSDPSDSSGNTVTPTTPSIKRTSLSLKDYIKKAASETPWVIEGIVPKGGLINVFAPPKAGKSYLVLDMALALAQARKSWLIFDVVEPGPVLYFQLDTPSTLWVERYLDLQDAGVNIECGDQMQTIDREMVDLPFDIMQEPHFELIRAEVAATKPVMVVIDTIREVHGEDENESGAMKNVVARIQAACHPSAVLVISHTRKRQHGNKSKKGKAEKGSVDLPNITDQNRGSGYLSGKADTLMWLLDDGMLMYKGRAFETDHVQLERNADTVLWELSAAGKHLMMARELIRDSWTDLQSGATTRASLGRVLKEKAGIDLDGANTLIYRQYKRAVKEEKRRLRREKARREASGEI